MNSTVYLTYISEMLTTHDAVVIPGFGGFITKYKPARISTESGLIHPPTKYIAFNEQLDIHDNTFPRYLDEKTSAHYSPRLFDHFVDQLKRQLSGNQVIVIPKVGRLYQDFEGATHFMPDLLNLNNDTFSLPSIAARKGEWSDRSLVIKAKEIKNSSLRTTLSAAASVALLFLLVWASTDVFRQDSGVNELSIVDAISEKAESNDSGTSADITAIEIEGTETEVIEANVTKTVPRQKLRAIIIVGAFGEKTNAAKMIRKIEALGYSGYQDKPYSLNRVGVEASYTSMEELDSILSNVQKDITSRAWILK